MELDELKNSWNLLDKRLSENEVVSQRLVKELIAQKTRTAYDRLYRFHIISFLLEIFMIALVFPFISMHTPISTASFVIVEIGLVLGLIPRIGKITFLSRFDLECKSVSELRGLILRYKQIHHRSNLWIILVVSVTMVAFYISELGFNNAAGYVIDTRIFLVIGSTLITFAIAYIVGLWQRRSHAAQMKEIEKGLQELEEFTKE